MDVLRMRGNLALLGEAVLRYCACADNVALLGEVYMDGLRMRGSFAYLALLGEVYMHVLRMRG